MKRVQKITFLTVYTLLFTALIFIGKEIFFPHPSSFEEKYIDPTLWEDYLDIDDQGYYSFSGVTQSDVNTVVNELIYDSFKQKYTQAQRDKVTFHYIPVSLKPQIENSYLPLTELFFYKKYILKNIEKLSVIFYKNKKDTRGRMKSKKIHLFGVLQMSDEEFLGVMIHEFWHYFDIYSFKRNNFWDTSKKFYDISWQSVSVIKKGLRSQDFVSGYAMTNQYEDFAESYLYYILHNRDFLKKAQENIYLAQKYNFFQDYVFPQKQFYKQDFSMEKELKVYYWDITKLSVDVKKFLQYLQSDV